LGCKSGGELRASNTCKSFNFLVPRSTNVDLACQIESTTIMSKLTRKHSVMFFDFLKQIY
jgi:hypothetical protein